MAANVAMSSRRVADKKLERVVSTSRKPSKRNFAAKDAALARAGRAREVLEKNVAALGIDPKGERPRLLSINGVRFRS